ncbi:hypothetical protein [Agrobacterium cavarae]|uniref:hypothetical protein n=1 Tax=Agrobacterium cavarae TaxID=2528239 RepID=UPI0028A1A53F|nr:hypothetical protein [Agrobacterium cavarae]
MNVCFAITAAVFAAIFLVAVIVYGGVAARNMAVVASFIACASQFTGQEPRSWKLSLYLAYAAFVAAFFALLFLLLGK